MTWGRLRGHRLLGDLAVTQTSNGVETSLRFRRSGEAVEQRALAAMQRAMQHGRDCTSRAPRALFDGQQCSPALVRLSRRAGHPRPRDSHHLHHHHHRHHHRQDHQDQGGVGRGGTARAAVIGGCPGADSSVGIAGSNDVARQTLQYCSGGQRSAWWRQAGRQEKRVPRGLKSISWQAPALPPKALSLASAHTSHLHPPLRLSARRLRFWSSIPEHQATERPAPLGAVSRPPSRAPHLPPRRRPRPSRALEQIPRRSG